MAKWKYVLLSIIEGALIGVFCAILFWTVVTMYLLYKTQYAVSAMNF